MTRIRSIFSKLIAFVVGIACATTAFSVDPSVNWVIGVLDSSMPQLQWVIRDTFHMIDPIYTDRRLVVRQLSADEIYDAVRTQSLDFVCASPQVVSVLERYYGYELLASLYQVDGKDFYSETTALVFTRKGMNRWEDLRGRTIALIEHDIPDTELLIMEDLHKRKFPEKRFCDLIRFPVLEAAIEMLRTGRVDALAISSCLYREVDASIFANFALIAPETPDKVKTLTPHTTSIFPGWAFASSIRVSRKTGEDFARALRSFDFSRSVTWDTAREYGRVHEAQEVLKFDSYLKFRQMTAIDFIRDNIFWFFGAMTLILALILHNILKERTVRRLTSELTQAMQKERLAEKRFEELEHIASVSQISSIVAHELRQPLAAVTNFAMGIRRRIKNKTITDESLEFALQRILLENQRASSIVDHVRNYAKRREKQSEKVHLKRLMSKSGLGLESVPEERVTFTVIGDPVLQVDALEMGLVIRNLVKNAVEATGEDPNGWVSVDLRTVGSEIVFTVTDNGSLSSDEELERLSQPMRSGKADGLGLGLSIVRKIVESYEGTIDFSRNIPRGLIVTVKFPMRVE